MKKITISFIIIVFFIFLAAGVAFAASEKGEVPEGEVYNFTMIIYGTAGNPFWKKVVVGTEEASDALGCRVDIQYAENDPEKQNNLIETAITNRVDGIGMIINLDDAYDITVRKALDAGIPVIAYNIDDSHGAEGNDRMAFIGQDFVTAGYLVTKRLVQEYNIGRGDHVVCPVEHPEAVYAVKRYEGVKKALDEAGASSEVLDTGAISLEDTLNKITQYLLGHEETDAILAMGGMPMEMAPQAAEEAGMSGLPNAGFDITNKIITNILEGKTLATVDQQPYYQGSFTIMQLYLNRKYGLLPCSINTGGAIIDKSNAEIVLELADTHR
jgi:simple sugar transport system substrate-binding protein